MDKEKFDRITKEWLMDSLDIFEINPNTMIQTTVSEIQKAYFTGAADSENNTDSKLIIHGDIV